MYIVITRNNKTNETTMEGFELLREANKVFEELIDRNNLEYDIFLMKNLNYSIIDTMTNKVISLYDNFHDCYNEQNDDLCDCLNK